MRRKIPSTAALVSFESAARHESSTGGGMVPETEMRAYLERGRSLLD